MTINRLISLFAFFLIVQPALANDNPEFNFDDSPEYLHMEITDIANRMFNQESQQVQIQGIYRRGERLGVVLTNGKGLTIEKDSFDNSLEVTQVHSLNDVQLLAEKDDQEVPIEEMNPTEFEDDWGLGFGWGYVPGPGIIVRKDINLNWGIQGVISPPVSFDSGSSWFWNGGITASYAPDFFIFEYFKIYFYLSAGTTLQWGEEDRWDPCEPPRELGGEVPKCDPNPKATPFRDVEFRAGTGMGVEARVDWFNAAVEIPFVFAEFSDNLEEPFHLDQVFFAYPSVQILFRFP